MTRTENEQKLYNGEIVAGSLLIPESRKIADFLLQEVSEEEWYQAVIIDNILQKRSPASAKRQAQLIRNRLSFMGPEHWVRVKDGNAEVATQALLAASIKHSRLLGDFMSNVCRQHWLTFNRTLSNQDWREFLETCALLDSAVGKWTATTTSKLRQVVFRILAEAGYMDSTRKLTLQSVSVAPPVGGEVRCGGIWKIIQKHISCNAWNVRRERVHMIGNLQDRLNKIIPRLTSDELLHNQGLGNEIGFYIFDYPPEYELEVRDYLQVVLKHIGKKKTGIRVKHINLFALIIDYLKEAKFLEKAIILQGKKGNPALAKALKGPLESEKIAKIFTAKADPDNHDLILISGVGSAWPMLRSHNLLNNLHPLMGSTPVVMFYPGVYTGAGMKLFGRMRENNYYRAFQLVP